MGRSEGTTEVTIPENVTIDELTQIVYDAGAIKGAGVLPALLQRDSG